MKKAFFALSFILFAVSSASLAHADNGDCTDKLLIDAVRANCKGDIKIDRGIIGHYQGEVTDTWIFSVKKGNEKKNLSIEAEGGNCVPATIQLKSDCP